MSSTLDKEPQGSDEELSTEYRFDYHKAKQNRFAGAAMTTKEQIIQELEQMPEPLLQKVLEFTKTLQAETTPEGVRDEIWQAYLASKREREEVYRRLADS